MVADDIQSIERDDRKISTMHLDNDLITKSMSNPKNLVSHRNAYDYDQIDNCGGGVDDEDHSHLHHQCYSHRYLMT